MEEKIIGIKEQKTPRKQTAISLQTKMDLLRAVDEKAMSKTEICKAFGIANSTLSTIIKNRDQITTMFELSMFEPNRKRMRTAKHEDLEMALLIWYKQASFQNVHLTGAVLMERADELAKQMGIEFSANPGWLERFKKRNGLMTKNLNTSRLWSTGTTSKDEDKKMDHIPLEPAIEIKEEPVDYEPAPSTSTEAANEEFILPHEESTWTPAVQSPPNPAVEPQLTLSVAGLASHNNLETSTSTSNSEQVGKKRKIKSSTFVPSTNGSEARPVSPVYNFGESSNPGSLKEPRKDQFDVFGEYIAAKLRSLDKKSRAYAQKAIGDIIFEAEMGKYLNEDSETKVLNTSGS